MALPSRCEIASALRFHAAATATRPWAIASIIAPRLEMAHFAGLSPKSAVAREKYANATMAVVVGWSSPHPRNRGRDEDDGHGIDQQGKQP